MILRLALTTTEPRLRQRPFDIIDFFGLDHFRKDLPQQSNFIGQFNRHVPMCVDQHAPQFRRDPLGADDVNFRRHLRDSRLRVASETKFQMRCEANGSQHPELVFSHPFMRIADRSNVTLAQITLAPDEVEHLLLQRVVEHAVDREITPLSILFRRTERHRIRPPSIGVNAVAPKGRDFDIPRSLGANDHNNAKRDTHVECLTSFENFANLLRSRIGRDVVVLRCFVEQMISNTPTSPQSGESRLLQSAHDFNRELALLDGIK